MSEDEEKSLTREEFIRAASLASANGSAAHVMSYEERFDLLWNAVHAPVPDLAPGDVLLVRESGAYDSEAGVEVWFVFKSREPGTLKVTSQTGSTMLVSDFWSEYSQRGGWAVTYVPKGSYSATS